MIYFLLCVFGTLLSQDIDKYFVTVCDAEHYNWAIEQIECINKHNSSVCEIAVYDLQLTAKQREHLTTLPHVVVRDLENKNTFLREQFVVRPNGRMSRGWYSWKPIAIHDALKKAPYFLYMDAGVRPKTDLTPIFLHLKENKSFFITTGHNLELATTKKQIDELKVTPDELALPSIHAAVMGISKELRESVIEPAYQTTSDIELFQDDGTSKGGFGYARYDQSIFSILVHKSKLPVLNREKAHLLINKEKIPFRSHYFFKFKPV